MSTVISRMKWGLNWRLAALNNGFRDATAYRWDFLFEVLGSAVVPALVQWVLWYALFDLGGMKEVGGMSYPQMIQYTIATVLFSQIRGGNHDFELAEMIRSGALSNFLLRPVSLVEFIYLQGVSPKLFIAGASLVAGIVFGHFFGIDPSRMIGATFLAFIGNIIHYQIGAILATVSFYWEEAYAVLMVKNMLVALLSGELLPLQLFPESMQWLWKSTPFYLYVYGPAQYALGNWSHAEFLGALGSGLLWMAMFWAMIRLSWRIGIRRYLSLGG